MSDVWAQFDQLVGAPPGVYLRKDTRIYYHPTGPSEPTNSVCVGVLVMCNPSTPQRSPSVGVRQPMVLDLTLKKAIKIFRASGAYKNPAIPFRPIDSSHSPYDPTFRVGKNPYLAVQNLFYVADKNMASAANWLFLPHAAHSEAIPGTATFIWCAWGVAPPIPGTPPSAGLPCFGLGNGGIDPVPPTNPYHPSRRYSYSDMTDMANKIAPHL